jgi:hypothetical protein
VGSIAMQQVAKAEREEAADLQARLAELQL